MDAKVAGSQNNMVDISFLLPTNKPGPNLQQVINNINSVPTKYKHEICVYSTFEVSGPNVKWVEEKEVKGPLYGFNYAAKHGSTGEYVCCMTDDQIFHPQFGGFDAAINLLKSEHFANRKYKITSLSCENGGICSLPKKGDRLGSILEVKDDGWPFGITMRYPFIHRDTLNSLLDGYIFHPEFRYHAGDIWLGYYLSFQGECGVECPDARLHSFHGSKNNAWEVVDCNTAYALIKNFQFGKTRYVEPERPYQSVERYYELT